MAVAKAAKAAPRTVTRDEPEDRAQSARMPDRDPNAIMTRDGRTVDLDAVRRQLRGDDRYDLKRMGIVPPAGWVYEWRTVSIKGAEDRNAQADDEQAGWTPVPADRHPGKIMPLGWTGPIELGGLMLKERDARLTAMSRSYQQRDANAAVAYSRDMAGMLRKHAPNVDTIADFSSPDAITPAGRPTGVGIERIPMGDPERSKGYTYTLDE